MRVGGIDGVEAREGRIATRMNLLGHFHQRILDIRRRERLAVVPVDPLAQPERDGLAVVALSPRLGKLGHGIQLCVVADQSVEDAHRHHHGRV